MLALILLRFMLLQNSSAPFKSEKSLFILFYSLKACKQSDGYLHVQIECDGSGSGCFGIVCDIVASSVPTACEDGK